MSSRSDKEQREGAVVSSQNLPGVESGKPATEGEDGPGGITAKNDESYKEQFPQAAAAGAARHDYELSADARRIQAQRRAQLAAKEQAEREGAPEPSDGQGEGEGEGDTEPKE